MLWLCAEHRQQDDRITVLTDDGDDAVVDAYQRDNIAVESLHGRPSTNKPASPVKTHPEHLNVASSAAERLVQ